jgi:glutamine phosphoribosylpyrophosphate amidotransferase
MLDNKCAFNQIYKFDSEHVIDGVSIRELRRGLSRNMAGYLHSTGKSYDCISAIPNTGYFYAQGVAEALGCRFARIFEKKLFKRTLGTSAKKRLSTYDSLLMSIDAVDKNAHTLFVDEALLSGLTVQIIANACQEIGLKRYSFAFMSPITLCHCPWGHIKHTDRWFESLNGDPTPAKVESLRRRLIDATQAQDIVHCPPEAFFAVIDSATNCSLCFFDGISTSSGGKDSVRQ